MPRFIEVNFVKQAFSRSNIVDGKEITEPVSVNIDAIEYVSQARVNESLITIARGYIRTKNSDFRVAETYEEIMNLIRGFDANN